MTNVTIDTQDLVDRNFETLIYKLEALVLDGWRIRREEGITFNGSSYVIIIERNPRRLMEMADRIISNAPPKKTRAEIMADARAARFKNKKQGESDQPEQPEGE